MNFEYINNYIIHSLAVFTAAFLLSVQASAQVDFTYRSTYKYLKGKDAASLNSSWIQPGFDDSAWPTADAPFRYGDGEWGLELTDMQNNYSTMYLRTTFQCPDTVLVRQMTLTVDYDDGFILWINGVVALQKNAPSSPAYNSFATANHESGTGENYIINTGSLNLRPGTNYIAVQGFNVSLTSSDFYFDLAISAEKQLVELVDTVGINFSARSGFYNSPFNVTLTSPDPSEQIVYTLDGSNPQNSATGFISDSPATLLIDPTNNSGRPLTPGVVLRASLAKTWYKPSKPVSRTYIFIDKVKTQSFPGGSWPGSNVNGQIIDLNMDPKVVNSPAYSGLMDQSLFDIPTISVVTDLKNLFDPATGIYVNAYGHGLSWERECSVELINPDGTDGFNVNAGLRIRGGWSRHDNFPKHSFRLFFREEYGNNKLFFPLFGNEGASEFDKVDLRCEQNYAWSTGSPYNSLVREVFSRDTQRDMGSPYTRSRYYHLYVDGMYWGVYQTQERPEARYASTYFGGSHLDYDVVKVNMDNWQYSIEATDGNLDSWSALWDLCNIGFSSNSNYFGLEGKDANGKPVRGSEVRVNIDNLIDYMLVIFYAGNFDAPTSSFFSNKMCNNFYAIDNRVDKSTGFVFFTHDAEHALFDEAHSPGIGLYENRVNIGSRTDDLRMEVNSFSFFHPQWLHEKLTANSEYRKRFADRAYQYFRPGGALTPDSCLARVNKRIAEIQMGVIAESARWGDAGTGGTYAFTKNDNWLPEIQKIRQNFMPARSNIVIGQLMQAGLYPLIDAPVVRTASEIITKTNLSLAKPLAIQILNPNSSGTIIYTMDGSDPRTIGDGINSRAIFSTSVVNMTVNASSVINARIYLNGIWSAPVQVNFINQQEDYSNLKVTEVSYHPPDYIYGNDTISGKDLEFIEFKNIGNNAINLTGLVLDSAIHYKFPDNYLLPPKKFYVVASKPSKFYDFYGLVASGNYKGHLSNAGEEVLLTDAKGNAVIHFTYDDSYPWPDHTDGDGYTLSSSEILPTGNPADYTYWVASYKKNGTPFTDNTADDPESNTSGSEGSLTAYPNPTSGPLNINILANEYVDKADVALYDLTGKQLISTAFGVQGSINLAEMGLPSGIYILSVKAGDFKARLRIVLIK